jgi:hypothetical protein
MKHADYQFIFIENLQAEAKPLCMTERWTYPSFSIFSLLSINMVIAFNDFVLLSVIRQETLGGKCISYSNSCQEKIPRFYSTLTHLILHDRSFFTALLK